MSGLFAHRSHNAGSTIWQAQRKRQQLSAFAQLLSEETPPEDAAQRLGYSRAYGHVLLAKLRKDINDRQRAAGFGDWA